VAPVLAKAKCLDDLIPIKEWETQRIRQRRLRKRLMTQKLEGMDVGEVECSTAEEVEAMGRASGEELEVKETTTEWQEGVHGATALLDLR
jgi:hypothetical protein